MRVFVALKLPREFLASLEETLRPLREKHPLFRWTGEENFHITLAFLGELEKSGVSLLEKAAERAVQGLERIPISGGKLFTLPRGKAARVLALDIGEGKESLSALAAALEKAMDALGQEEGFPLRPPEKRPFRAHITLARRGSSPLCLPREEENPLSPIRGTLRELAVFKSELFREGPRYSPLRVYSLGP
ncbi:MAG: RNA 2',3'-cyclic phosphodiesterase [Treponema sp.]|jgi:2'-5' RNA ligase|nr:RNA 2',3'-cyclic phosphodiesterase [Treponema sp.]